MDSKFLKIMNHVHLTLQIFNKILHYHFSLNIFQVMVKVNVVFLELEIKEIKMIRLYNLSIM